ncbi:MAG: hypothetical protein M4579_007354 [Chaenotheca gracillima]|nr:MAG: hypothetical protein M4579_007354 [Chaenotheca gracillima]
MQFTIILISSLALLTTAWSSPVADVSIPAPGAPVDALEKRSDHQANFYTTKGCPGSSYVDSVYDFGCGGTCHTFSKGLESVYLQYGGQGNKPTADCFTSFDCTGGVNTHSGILKGLSNSCTDTHSLVYSCYVYDGC